MASPEAILQSPSEFVSKKPKHHTFSPRQVLKQRKNRQAIRSTLSENLGRRSLSEHVYITENRTVWKTEITPNTECIFAPKPIDQELFLDVREALSTRQRPYIPESSEDEHLNTILFLSRNWGKIRKTLYPFEVSGEIPAACFSEVVLNGMNNHRADFIGFGPDGRVFIVEVGKRAKSAQAQGYVESFKTLFCNRVSATPLVAYYSSSGNEKNIYIKPPFMPEIRYTDRAINYIQELGRNTPQNPIPSSVSK